MNVHKNSQGNAQRNAQRNAQGKTLFERCLKSLQQLDEYQEGLNQEEQAIHDHIESITDPLKWDEGIFDTQMAKAMLKKMAALEDRKIQISVLIASVRGIKAIAAYPTDTYI